MRAIAFPVGWLRVRGGGRGIPRIIQDEACDDQDERWANRDVVVADQAIIKASSKLAATACRVLPRSAG